MARRFRVRDKTGDEVSLRDDPRPLPAVSLGHLTYLRATLERCQRLIITITNHDPATIPEETKASRRRRRVIYWIAAWELSRLGEGRGEAVDVPG